LNREPERDNGEAGDFCEHAQTKRGAQIEKYQADQHASKRNENDFSFIV